MLQISQIFYEHINFLWREYIFLFYLNNLYVIETLLWNEILLLFIIVCYRISSSLVKFNKEGTYQVRWLWNWRTQPCDHPLKILSWYDENEENLINFAYVKSLFQIKPCLLLKPDSNAPNTIYMIILYTPVLEMFKVCR